MALLRQSAAAGWVSARQELQRVLGATRHPARGARGHAIGQRELARLRTEVEAVMKELKFSAWFAQVVEQLASEERFFHKSPDALRARYRDIAKRIDAEMSRRFVELPRVPYGIRTVPEHRMRHQVCRTA